MSQEKRNAAAVGGWCCLVIALLLAVWQPVTFIIYLPLFLAAFILAIVAIAQKRITNGILLLILSIVLSLGSVAYGVSAAWRGISTIASGTISTPASSSPNDAASLVWHYSSSADPMGRGTTRIGEIQSDNLLGFDFPYAGPQRATLLIVNSAEYGLQARVDIQRGQFLCPSYKGCTVHVRFDDQPMTWMHASPSDDGDSTVLFLDEPKAIVAGLMRSKTFRVEAPFWQQGTHVLTFPVAGFDAMKVLSSSHEAAAK